MTGLNGDQPIQDVDDGDQDEAEYVDDGDSDETPPGEADERYLPADDQGEVDTAEDEPE